jgi:alpha-beta hydrolase superfamily lysophospholipase
MNERDGRLAGAGGLAIHWQSWTPEQPPAVVVIAHGASEHAERYRHVADRLVADGYAVYAIEHRGHGRSEGRRALIDRLDRAVADLDALVQLAAAEHPGVPVFLIGHSMGGAIAISYALEHQDRLAGLILSGPVAALDTAPAPMRVLAAVLSTVTPRLPLFEIDASLVSRDPAVVEAYVNDPLVYHGKLPVRTVAELAKAVDAFPERVPSITVPTLILHGTDDHLAPPEGSAMLNERIGASDKTFHRYEGLYHEIFNEPEQERVLDDVSEWLSAHVLPVAAASAEAGSEQ